MPEYNWCYFMEQTTKQVGGKRLNAGRKPSGIIKKGFTIYVKDDAINKFGGIKELRKSIYDHINNLLANDNVKIILFIIGSIAACFADNIFK